jgi:hypothetical protein
MSRQSVDLGKMSVPSVATDRNGQTFMSRQARGITMIEYMSRQAGDHPRSGRRDNSFMPRRPYAGVAPAQPGPTPVASTSTSAGLLVALQPSAYGHLLWGYCLYGLHSLLRRMEFIGIETLRTKNCQNFNAGQPQSSIVKI